MHCLEKGYSEIAAESRSMHKSQGFGATKGRGVQVDYFKTLSGNAPKSELMDGVVTSWSRLPGGESVQPLVTQLMQQFQMENPSLSVAKLVEIADAIQNLPNSVWKSQKKKEVEQLIQMCSGLWFEAYATSTTVSPGAPFEWKIQGINRSTLPIVLKSVTVQQFDTTLNKTLTGNELITLQRKQVLDKSTSITQPYWLQQPHPLGTFRIPNQQWVGRPENEPPVNASFIFTISGRDFVFNRPIVYKFTDPVKGEVYQPLEVSPPVTANIEEAVYLFSSSQSHEVKVRLKSAIDDAKGFVSLKAPQGWKITPSNNVFELAKKGDETSVVFTVSPASASIVAATDTMKAVIELNGQTYNRGELSIAYDYIPDITIYRVAQSKLVAVPLEIKGKSLGYISGAGDIIPDLLRQAGYRVAMLGETEIAGSNLQQYDAIIVGVRSYNTDDWLKFQNEKLLDYVKTGGTMLVQYNTTFDLVTDKIGPYPFKIERDRVTDEGAPVTFLKPNHELLNVPNKITQKDFDGWVPGAGFVFRFRSRQQL
jgi:hypothetical protein